MLQEQSVIEKIQHLKMETPGSYMHNHLSVYVSYIASENHKGSWEKQQS